MAPPSFPFLVIPRSGNVVVQGGGFGCTLLPAIWDDPGPDIIPRVKVASTMKYRLENLGHSYIMGEYWNGNAGKGSLEYQCWVRYNGKEVLE